jgi:hypothetical protein
MKKEAKEVMARITGKTKTLRFGLQVDPEGLNLEAKITVYRLSEWRHRSLVNLETIPFISTGQSQDICCDVTIPDREGKYLVHIDVCLDGKLVHRFRKELSGNPMPVLNARIGIT